MAEFSFTNVEDKVLNTMKISVASISPKMDLIATGSSKGTLALYRYKMVLAWSSENPDLGAVTHICWRPDGEMIAVAYSSGELHYCLLEDGYIFHSITFENPVIHLHWVSNQTSKSQEEKDQASNEMATSLGWSCAKRFLPEKLDFQNFNNDYFTSEKQETMDKIMNISAKLDENINFLVVASGSSIYIYAQGLYLLVGFDLEDYDPPDMLVKAILSRDYSHLIYYGIKHLTNGEAVLREYKINLDDTLSNMTIEDHETFSLHKGILSCKKMLSLCMTQIKEAWEDTLLELNTKLTQYAASRKNQEKNWSLRNELLEYLLFGHCPKQLKQFLVGWTASGIKKLGMTLAKTYETIQKICYCQIQAILQWILLFSTELLGIVRADHTRPLCLRSDPVEQLVRDAGAALQKTQEVELVIDKVTQHLKTFFVWLYECILELSGSENKSNYTLSQSDQELIVDFISNQLIPTVVDEQIESYHIELVEQYIMEGELKKGFQTVFGEDPYSRLRFAFCNYEDFEEMPDSFYPYYTNSSLVDVIEKKLFDDISKCFDQNWALFTMTFVNLFHPKQTDILLFEDSADSEVISNFCLSSCSYLDCSTEYSAIASQAKDSILFYFDVSYHETSCCIEITLDRLPGDESIDGRYKIEDLKFQTDSHSSENDCLALLVSRVETSSPSHYLVFIKIETIRALFSTTQTCAPVSQLVTVGGVERLPRRAVRLELNPERNLAFIVFENPQQCRTYILEPLETEDSEE